jgi:hypothetical protein
MSCWERSSAPDQAKSRRGIRRPPKVSINSYPMKRQLLTLYSNVIAYSLGQYAPQPYRFKSTSLKLQVPSLSSLFPDTRFWREMRNTAVWIFLTNTLFHLRTWARRSIWGDRVSFYLSAPSPVHFLTGHAISSFSYNSKAQQRYWCNHAAHALPTP